MWRWMTPLLLLVACSGPRIEVPATPPPGGCLATAAPGPPKRLKALKPGPKAGPLKLGQLLTMPEAPTELQWKALPPTADAALVEAAADPEASETERVRAFMGLAVRRTEGGEAPILASLKAGPGAVRRGAARALAAGYLATALPALVEAGADEDPTLREAVARALWPHTDNDGVAAFLAARREAETHPLVREALEGKK